MGKREAEMKYREADLESRATQAAAQEAEWSTARTLPQARGRCGLGTAARVGRRCLAVLGSSAEVFDVKFPPNEPVATFHDKNQQRVCVCGRSHV